MNPRRLHSATIFSIFVAVVDIRFSYLSVAPTYSSNAFELRINRLKDVSRVGVFHIGLPRGFRRRVADPHYATSTHRDPFAGILFANRTAVLSEPSEAIAHHRTHNCPKYVGT